MYTPSFSICAGQLGTRPGWWIWSWWMPQWKRCWRRRTRSQMADWLELGYQRTLWAYNGLNSVCGCVCVCVFLNLSMIYVLIWFGIHLFGCWIKIHQTCVYIYICTNIYIHGTYLLYIYICPLYVHILSPAFLRGRTCWICPRGTWQRLQRRGAEFLVDHRASHGDSTPTWNRQYTIWLLNIAMV